MTQKLSKKFVEKVWGRNDLSAPFDDEMPSRIGEVWFEPCASVDGILAKYIFTSEKLSVQVHPSDAQAQGIGSIEKGKEECWLVLDAEQGAVVALGLDDEYAPEVVCEAAKDGAIEEMLVWHTAQAGDFFHVPPGTIHAIGPGLKLLEIQQNTDVTYRLFDYGRPRELHLDEAMACAHFAPYSQACRKFVEKGPRVALLDSAAFSVELLRGTSRLEAEGPLIILPLAGEILSGGREFKSGSCLALDAGDVVQSCAGAEFVVARDKQF